jgi:hypothetical protein
MLREVSWSAGNFIWKRGKGKARINVKGHFDGWRATFKESRGKKVTQYTLDQKAIRTYASIADASKETGISHSHISRVMRGIEEKAGGFVWRCDNEKEMDEKSLSEARRKESRKNYKRMTVTQYDMQGNRIACYPSLTDAQNETGIGSLHISLAVKGVNKSAGGYYWEKGCGKKKINLTGHKWGIASAAASRSKKVNQYTIDGKYVRTFDSIKEAAAYAGIHSSTLIGALTGRQITSGGYKWEYATKKFR